MDDRNHFDTITFETFTELLAQYPDVVPAKMEKLDEQRLYAIPKIIHQRELKFITKDELSTLMQWKLYVPRRKLFFNQYMQVLIHFLLQIPRQIPRHPPAPRRLQRCHDGQNNGY